MKVIILAGGSGTRLWPLSRTDFPKQFLKLKNMGRSLFQMTLQRSLQLTDLPHIYVVTNAAYRFLVLGQLALESLEQCSPTVAYNLGSGRGYSVLELIKAAER